jgi:hypothetical protein
LLEPYGVQVYDTAGATVGAVPNAIAPTLTITDLAAGDNVFKVTAKNVNGTSLETAALTKTMTQGHDRDREVQDERLSGSPAPAMSSAPR